ncbi:MAG TPA: ABC transporter permease [Planctomycetota bacterium]
MNSSLLVFRGLRHYRRTHLGVLIGCAVSTAVLGGALYVGDSVRVSLQRAALARLGPVVSAMETGDRYFRDDLPARLATGAAALRVRGMALRTDGGQVNRVDVYGVDARFLGRPAPPAGQVALGERLAAAIGAKAGGDVTLRYDKPSLLAKDAPLSSRKESGTIRRLLAVSDVLPDDRMGRFSLRSDQAPAMNAFVDLRWLQGELNLEGWANVLIAPGLRPAGAASAAQAGDVDLARAFTIRDAGLEVKAFPAHGVLQVQSPRVYLDPAGAAAVRAAAPKAAGVLSFLVNDLIVEGGTSTPYSFATAIEPGAGPVPADLKDDEILVNQWVSDRTGAKAGGRLTMTYFEIRPGNTYAEKRRDFRIRGVIPMEALVGERALVPEFPGLTDVESCSDWEIDIPTDEKKLNDKENEAYWKKHKQTPKAFVTLAAGQAMWGNRFGDLMAFRLPMGDAAALEAAIRAKLDPAAAGLIVRPAREEALRAAAESMDLGQLFLGMSAFLIGASLTLTAMLFVFSVEQRAREMGVLLATGFTPGRVRRLFLAEGAVIAFFGAAAGLPVGSAFARALVDGLRGAWSGAVASAEISFHASPASSLTAVAAGFAISLGAMALALWRQAKRPVRELVADDFTLSLETRARGTGLAAKVALATSAAAAAAVALAVRTPPGFFGAGALLLVAGLAALRLLLRRLSTPTGAMPTPAALGVRNAGRRPGRGMAAAGMLACGAFLVVSVSAMREDFTNSAGAGGFALYAESSVPITENLNDPRDRDKLRLTELKDATVVAMKARDGDDASCLNLNQSLTPPLLGVDPAALKGRFGADWSLLDQDLGPDVVPAIVGDAATPVWKLKKSIGARLDYADERGRPFKVQLVGALPTRLSIFQGRMLVSEARFGRLYPAEAGTRVFAIDTAKPKEVAEHLTRRLGTAGFEVTTAAERLERFYRVEATYLAMFQVLGGLGVLLGSAGMGVLVLRNVMERRSELALLRAVGYTKAQAVAVVQTEHRVLVLAGLAAGTLASALAVLPSAARPDADIPLVTLAAFLGATALLAFVWIGAATRAAMRAELVRALRNE